MIVRIGGLVVRERRDRARDASESAVPVAVTAVDRAVVDCPRMLPVDPDSVEDLTWLWTRVQEDEPRAVLAPWFVRTCHGRLSTVDVAQVRGNRVTRYHWNEHDVPV